MHRRTPKNYDGTATTTHKVSDLLSMVLTTIGETFHENSDLILDVWPEVVGLQLAPMTKALSFREGILTVSVKNSTLHSLLKTDKFRILSILKKRFPKVEIKDISFRIG
jgi:hypothetical protein